jgi:hypothetical protein
MQENETAPDATTTAAASAESTPKEGGEQPQQQQQSPTATEEITYHAVEKDGQVTAIWEMQGRKHLRTIDPRSRQGQDILRLYTADHQDEASAAGQSES